MRARLLRTIDLLAKNGTALRMPYSEHLVDGIFEIRAKSGSNISRVLYFFVIGRKIVLTNGFVKKTQKTAQNEIDQILQNTGNHSLESLHHLQNMDNHP